MAEKKALEYQFGFGSHFSSEALKDALPRSQNNPQRCPYGLYAEQLSGSAFTEPRAVNLKSWLYRIRPSVKIGGYKSCRERAPYVTVPEVATPERLRWKPLQGGENGEAVDFLRGLRTIAGQGEPENRSGLWIYLYSANVSMRNSCFCSADGDFLIVPQSGELRVASEMGRMDVAPGHICVVPRGIRFSVQVKNEEAAISGYACEVFGRHFELPERGLIGANGLANESDFAYPTAWYEDQEEGFEIVTKYHGEIFTATLQHSPFDVVAWRGNYAPFSYNLDLYCPINSVLFDHMDPSIFTVLTCRSDTPGVALLDFAIFPPRWMTQENTFRPPYFHRNCMTEYMGLIRGVYDAKTGGGFVPGGGSLHSITAPHGPDEDSYAKASSVELVPQKIATSSLAFMFETSKMLKVSQWALDSDIRDSEYINCWNGLESRFDPSHP